MKYLWIAVVLIAVAVGGTLFRYGSLHPCEWLEQDTIETSGMPPRRGASANPRHLHGPRHRGARR